MRETLFTLASDAILRVAGGDEWTVDVSLVETNGNTRTESITVIARSQEEAEEAALAKAKTTCFTIVEPKKSLKARLFALPFNEAGRKRMFMPGGYVPGSMIQGALSNIRDNIQTEKNDRSPSVVALDIRSRNCFIFLILHLLLFPIGILFFYAGLFSPAYSNSALHFFNQYVTGGLLCFSVGGIGSFRAGRDMLRFEKMKSEKPVAADADAVADTDDHD